MTDLHPGLSETRPFALSVAQWTLGEPDLHAAFDRVARAGYDGVELATDRSPEDLRRALAASGLSATAICPAWGSRRDFASEAPSVRRSAAAELHRAIQLASEVEAAVVIVVPSDRPDRPPGCSRQEMLFAAAATITGVLDQYPGLTTDVVIEPLNRYETHLVRTLDDAAALCQLIGSPRIGLMADVFHMHLEEDSLTDPLLRHGAQLRHVHLADNQRREPGSGCLDLETVISVLLQAGYQGAFGNEFLPTTDDALKRGQEHLSRLIAALPRS